ncbi:MAG: RidA family protein [Clostridiales bacterium]|nr:RidA family protein [Clostridiales bacterium]
MRMPICTEKAPAAIGPYNQGLEVGDFVFVSGQLGMTSDKQFPLDAEGQARQALENIGNILAAAGLDFSHVAKATIFLTDMKDFQAVNEVYGQFMTEPYPARSTIAVKELPLGGLVEIEAIACR